MSVRRIVASLIASAIIFIGFGFCFAADKTSITTSGETLYYVGTAMPVINVAPVSLAFGNVAVGNSSPLSVVVTNNGAGDLIIGTVTSPSSPYSKTADFCSGKTLAQSQTCSITITFTPTINGTFPTSFNIPSNDSTNANFAVNITGSSNGAMINASPNPLSFGSVATGSFLNSNVTITNTGSANLTLTTVGSPAVPFTKQATTTCTNGLSIPPAGTCTLVLRFSPTATGTFSSSLNITSNAANSPTLTVNMTGTSGQLISVSPNPDDFGNVVTGNFLNSTITVSNAGSAGSVLTLGNPALTLPTAPFTRVSTTCTNGMGLASGSSCTITMRFSPTSTGTFNGSFIVYSNTGGVSNTPTTVNLTGKGILPNPTCSASFSPSSITNGQTSTLSWTLTTDADNNAPYSCTGNLGNGTLSGASGSVSASPTSTQTCTFNVDNGTGGTNTCTATVTVVPQAICTASFSPSTIAWGQTSGLSWTLTNDADNSAPYSCTGNLGTGTASGATGSSTVTPAGSQTCTFTVANSLGATNTCTATVAVSSVPVPSCTATFTPGSITTGQTSTLSWTLTGDFDNSAPYSCTGNLGNGTASGATGSSVKSPTATQTCTFTVDNGAGTTNTCTAAVTIVPASSCTASFSPASITNGSTSSLSWTLSNDADNSAPYSCTGNLGSGILSGITGSSTKSPTATQTCTLTVTNSLGAINTCTATVTVVPPPSCSTSFSPASITNGQTSTLSWTLTNDADNSAPYTCTGNLGTGTASGATGSSVKTPTATQTCTLTVQNSAGTTNTCTATVTVVPQAICSASFSPGIVTTGQTSTLSWTLTNDADNSAPYSCTGNLGSGTAAGATGSSVLSPTATQTCTLTVANALGATNTCSAVVLAGPAPSCTASFTPASITTGSTSTLSWTLTNDADNSAPYTCTGNLGSGTASGATGTSVKSPTATQTCTLTVNNGAGTSNTCTATVTVVPQASCTSSFSPASITTGQTSTLSWTLTNDADNSAPYSCTGNLGSGTASGATGSSTKSPTATQTCTLTVANSLGATNTCTASVTVVSPPSCTASFAPASITNGSTSTLSWTLTNDADNSAPYSCTGNLGSGTASGASGSSVKSPTSTQTCTLTVDNGAGTTNTCTATVTIVPQATCTASFSPGSITTGQNSTLSWTLTNDADNSAPYTCTGNLGSGTASGATGSSSKSPSTTQTCTLTVANSLGATNTCTVSVTVLPPSSCTASFSPASITNGSTSTLSWTLTNDADNSAPYTCTGNLGSGTASGASGSSSKSPSITQTCTLTVDNGAGGTNTCTATVTVVPIPTCTASFSPTSITNGSTSTLSWTSANDADSLLPYSCTGNLGSGTFSGASGSASTSPTTTQTCTLTVANSLGATNTCTATVTVAPPASCTASFSPASITGGQTSTLSWTLTNDADNSAPYTCTGNLGTGTASGATGSSVKTPTATQTCTLTVQNSSGTTNTCTATVTVNTAPSCTASFNPTSILSGQTSTLSWTSTNDADGHIPYSCTGNLGSGTFATASGSASTSPTTTQTCTLTVDNGVGGTNTCAATITICGQISDSTASIDFGLVPVSGSLNQTITVSNTGGGNLTLSSISTSGAPFFVAAGGTCTNGISIPAGGSCTILAQFAPSNGGGFNGSLTISNNSQCTSQNSTVALAGMAVASGGYLTGPFIEYASHLDTSNVWNSTWNNAYYSGPLNDGWLTMYSILSYSDNASIATYPYPYRVTNLGGSTLTLWVQNGDCVSSQTLPVCKYGASYTRGTYYDTNSGFRFNYILTLPPNSACVIAAYEYWAGNYTAGYDCHDSPSCPHNIHGLEVQSKSTKLYGRYATLSGGIQSWIQGAGCSYMTP